MNHTKQRVVPFILPNAPPRPQRNELNNEDFQSLTAFLLNFISYLWLSMECEVQGNMIERAKTCYWWRYYTAIRDRAVN